MYIADIMSSPRGTTAVPDTPQETAHGRLADTQTLPEAIGTGAVEYRRGTHIPALDGLRGLAIILVIFFHFTVNDKSADGIRRVILHATNAGWIGVDLFFVLSGFLITSILLDAKGTQGYFRNFYMRRVLRIFPLYYGTLLVAFVIIPLFHPVAVRNEWALWVYLANFFPARGSAFIHFWSLAVEEQFYLVWPAVVLLLGRRWLMGVCVALIATALACRFQRVLTGANTELTYYMIHCRMDSLAVGALLALAARGQGGMAALATPAKVTMAVSVAVLGGIYVYNHAFFGYADKRVQTIGYTLLALFFGSLLVLTVLAKPGAVLGRAFSTPALRFFGKYSYGIYVIHGLLHPWIKHQFPPEAMPKGPLFYAAVAGRIAIGTAISVAGAVLIWHIYEKHFLKLKRFFEYRARTLTKPVREAILPNPLSPALTTNP
jgi:peptidoglycan/LPS O-acetylase OafA/YrhL